MPQPSYKDHQAVKKVAVKEKVVVAAAKPNRSKEAFIDFFFLKITINQFYSSKLYILYYKHYKNQIGDFTWGFGIVGKDFGEP